jgi:hypothetical protein
MTWRASQKEAERCSSDAYEDKWDNKNGNCAPTPVLVGALSRQPCLLSSHEDLPSKFKIILLKREENSCKSIVLLRVKPLITMLSFPLHGISDQK